MTHTHAQPTSGPSSHTNAVAPVTKPRMRGWLHLVACPILVIAAGILLFFARDTGTRIAVVVYLLGALMLFGVSATYHRGTWSPKTLNVLRRWDHSNIFVFIAGTYTPLAVGMLEGTSRTVLLALVWGVGLLGLVTRMIWLGAPRKLYTVLYVAMGWIAIGWIVPFYQAGGPLVVALIIVGGLIYSLGAVAYAFKRPNPWPGTFGFHEVFHLCTVIAAACHFAAITMAVV